MRRAVSQEARRPISRSSTTGIGLIAAGMARQDFDLQLTRYDDRVAGDVLLEHSVTTVAASAWEVTPWSAVQRAAWESLMKADAA